MFLNYQRKDRFVLIHKIKLLLLFLFIFFIFQHDVDCVEICQTLIDQLSVYHG